MEYLQHGDLDSCLTAPMPENEAREITFQIAEGLEHLHENHFVHRDLKPAVREPISSTRKTHGANTDRTYLWSDQGLSGGSK